MTTALVPGSLRAIARAQQSSLAQSFMHAELIVLVDTSGSMGIRDSMDGDALVTRYTAACTQLTRLQATHPGKIAVIAFSSHAVFCPGGIPENLGGGTDMAQALRYVQPADGCGMTFVLISDGQPDDEAATLAVAATFTTPIQTIFIGQGSGADFLRRLAQRTGGTALVKSIPQLAASVAGLLTTKTV